MDFVRNGVVPPFRHGAAHVFRRCHASDLIAVRLPECGVLGLPCLRVLYHLVQALLLEVERAQPHPIGLDRTTGVRVGKRPEVSSGTALAVTVLPEIRELRFLSANAEDRGPGTELAPAFTSQTPQFSQRSMQALANDLAAPQPNFVDAMRLFRIATVTHVVDQEHAHLRQCKEGFPSPFLDQVWWRHDQARKRSSSAVNQHAPECDQGLARAALCDNVCIACQLPSLAHAHNCQCLGWIRNTYHP